MGRGKDLTERKRTYCHDCLMCGEAFRSVRPEGQTCSNKCRSALRRWRLLYACDPIIPPGDRIRPTWRDNRAEWFARYLPPNHPRNKPLKPKKRA